MTDFKKEQFDTASLEQRYARMLDNMTEGCHIIGFDWRYLYLNDAAARHGNQPKEKLLGATMMECYPGIEDTKAFQLIRKCMEQREQHSLESEFIFPDGSKGWFYLTISPDSEGISVTSIDITDRKKTELALQESERLLNDTGSMAKVGGWELDAQTLEVKWTEQTYHMHEVPLDYKPPLDEAINFFHPDDRERLSAAISLALEKGEPYDMEVRFITAKGKHLWTRTKCIPQMVNNKVIALKGIFHDITERKQAEISLRESENRYQELLSRLPIGVYRNTPGPSGQFIMANETIASMFGYESVELFLQCNVSDLYAEPSERRNFSAELMAQGKVDAFELHLIKKDGSRFWGAVSARVVRSNKGDIEYFDGIIEDITESKRAEENLRESEEKFRTLFNNAPLGMFRSTPSGRFLEVNLTLAVMLGYESPPEVLAEIDDIAKQIYVRSEKRGAIVQENIMASGATVHTNRYRRRDGDEFTANLYLKTIYDNSGNILYLEGIVEDITKRLQTEEELEQALYAAERQARELQLLLDGAKDVLEGTGFSSTARRIFDAACEMTGAVSGYVALLSDDGEENEVLFLESGGLPCSVDENLPMPIRGLRGEAYKSGKAVFDNDFMNSPWAEYMPGGHVELRNVLFAPLNIEGKTAGVMGLANKPDDFTEDDSRIASAFGQQAAIALRNSIADEKLIHLERRNQALLDYSPLCHKIVDLDFNLQYMSANGFKMLKIDVDADLYGKPYPFYFFSESFRMEMMENMKKVQKTGDPIVMEALTNDIEGNDVWLESAIIPVFNDSGKINYLTVVTADTTRRKKDLQEKEKLQAQLQQAHKMEAIGTLAGGISHDFNNLLQAINGYTQLLLMDKTDTDPEYNSLKAIQDAGFRASDLVRQLLLFSRKADSTKRPLELQHEVDQAKKMLERTIPKMIKIQVLYGTRLWAINADPIQIEQMLLNLGTNAADAMPDGGKLIFEIENATLDHDHIGEHPAAQPGRYVLLSISDTGHGMDKAIIENIFDPFFTTKEFGKGTGLGLASVYGIVKNHGGRINCDSEVGRGTTFKIYLPAIVQPELEGAAIVESKPIPRGTETILLVDDEEAIRGFAQQALMKFGYKVFTAASGEEALELYSEKSDVIDIVITDIGMPGMGGCKFLQEVLQMNPKVKVIIASGYSINGQVKQAMEAGAKGYVGKPYQLADLLNTVRAVLNEEE